MKRLLVLLVLFGMLLAAPMAHLANAKPASKVDVCHVNSANDVIDLGPFGVVAFGKVVSVSANAVAAHEAHGDSTVFEPVDENSRDLLEDLFGISLPNADCGFVVAP